MFEEINLGADIAPISSYNVLLGLGMIAFFLSLETVVRKNAIPSDISDKIKKIALLSGLVSIGGAALMEAIYQRDDSGLKFSGFTFYGGLLTALLSVFGLSRLMKVDFFFVVNALSSPLILAHAFGRLGCFLGGCCYGIPTEGYTGVCFPPGSIPHQHYGTQHIHPTQLYEFALLLLLWASLNYTNIKYRFIVYLISYPVIRIVIEQFRGDNRGALFIKFLSPSQEISLLLFIVGIGLLLKLKL